MCFELTDRDLVEAEGNLNSSELKKRWPDVEVEEVGSNRGGSEG